MKDSERWRDTHRRGACPGGMWNPRQPQRLWEVQGIAALDTRVPGSVPALRLGENRSHPSLLIDRRSTGHRERYDPELILFSCPLPQLQIHIFRASTRAMRLSSSPSTDDCSKSRPVTMHPPLFMVVDNEEPEIRSFTIYWNRSTSWKNYYILISVHQKF